MKTDSRPEVLSIKVPCTSVGLTTTEAAFIEQARNNGELYIAQPYQLYSEDNHAAWKSLFGRMRPQWDRFANEHFMKGIESLCLDPNRVPKLDDVNQFLNPLTGFKAKAVSGYVPAYLFFDCLSNREFPTTITIRRHEKRTMYNNPHTNLWRMSHKTDHRTTPDGKSKTKSFKQTSTGIHGLTLPDLPQGV